MLRIRFLLEKQKLKRKIKRLVLNDNKKNFTPLEEIKQQREQINLDLITLSTKPKM
jgi:hypothetical protein